MDNLRTILIIAGICILPAIYFWDTIQNKRRLKRQRINSSIDVKKEPDLVISSKSSADVDFSSELAELNSFMAGSHSDEQDDAEPQAIIISRDSSVQTAKGWGRGVGTEIPDLFSQSQQEEEVLPVTSGQSSQTDISADSVISLYIVASADTVLRGSEIYAALTGLGFKFGEMNIFHHYGIGQLKSDQPLFSLVNMYEPGYFDINLIDDMTTRGLSVFMCLPTAHSSDVVFAYMLEIARRLASKLEATVLGPDRKEISQKTLDSITIQLNKHEQ